MLNSIKAEFIKLITVRSTYIIGIVLITMAAIFSGYAAGYKGNISSMIDAAYLQNQIVNSVSYTAVFGAIIIVLLVTHEYRYNTIMYSLTSSSNRLKFLFSKAFASSVFGILLAALIGILAPIFAYVGASLAGNDVGPQSIDIVYVITHVLFYAWAWAMFGFLIAVVFRNQVFAIVALIMSQSTIEPLITLLLKEKGAYLPFTATNSILYPSTANGGLTESQAITTTVVYVVVFSAIAVGLFVRRDAN